jgi:hypothetical protein
MHTPRQAARPNALDHQRERVCKAVACRMLPLDLFSITKQSNAISVVVRVAHPIIGRY